MKRIKVDVLAVLILALPIAFLCGGLLICGMPDDLGEAICAGMILLITSLGAWALLCLRHVAETYIVVVATTKDLTAAHRSSGDLVMVLSPEPDSEDLVPPQLYVYTVELGYTKVEYTRIFPDKKK